MRQNKGDLMKFTIFLLLMLNNSFGGVAKSVGFEFAPQLADVDLPSDFKADTVKIPITITNYFNESLELVTVVDKFSPKGFWKKDDKGNKIPYPYDVSDKIEVSEKRFKLQPKEKRIIYFTYNVEKGRKGSVYFRYTFVQDKNKIKRTQKVIKSREDMGTEIGFKIKYIGRAAINFNDKKTDLKVHKHKIKVDEKSSIFQVLYENTGNRYISKASAEVVLFEDGKFIGKKRCLIGGQDFINLYPESKKGVECVFSDKIKGKVKGLFFLKRGREILGQNEIILN